MYHAAAYGPSKHYGEEGKIVYDCVASSSHKDLTVIRERAARVTFTPGYRVGISKENKLGGGTIRSCWGPDEMWENGTQIYSFIKE